MKSVFLTGLRQLEIREGARPGPLSGRQVLLRMKSVGVCGSDVHYYSSGRIGSQVVQYPFTIGHEGAAVVEAVGGEVTSVKPGDRVAVEPAVSCYECDQCRSGRHHTCRSLKFLGCPGQLAGCLQEYIVMPEESCLSIPDNMSFEQACLAEPLAIGCHAVRLSALLEGARIGILGLGPIGLSVMLAARQAGAARIYGSDILDYRCRKAVANGIDWAGNPHKTDVLKTVGELEPRQLDAVFECCGQQAALDQALLLLKPGGRLMIVGIPEFERYSWVADLARRHEICIQHVRRQNHCAKSTIAMIADHTLDPSFMATHRYRLEDYGKAFELVANYEDEVIKAMIEF